MTESGIIRSYQSTGSRDPIWTQVARDPEDGLTTVVQNRLQGSRNDGNNPQMALFKRVEEKKGLNVFSAAVFITGEMAGSGILALPRAIVDSGWIGLILLVYFCINAGFGGSCLGKCWDMIEERFPEHRGRTRNPYAMIGYRAVGKWGGRFVSACIQFNLFGAGTVYLLLSSQIMQQLLNKFIPGVSFCIWFLVIAGILIPAMWLGSPKDFWVVGIAATLTTAIACVLIFTQIVMDGLNNTEPVKHSTHSFYDFFLSFGTLLFAFGGASTFPTIQNDMENRKQFTSSTTMAFTVILALYLPVSAGGYFVYGENVDPNIIISVSPSVLTTLANIMLAAHLVLAFLIVINPVCQELEEMFNVPPVYHWKRCVLRTCMVLVMVFIGETIPKFNKILSLVGGSTITLTTFVFPPWFYMRLCKQTNSNWPERNIPRHIELYLWELILIGVIGGTASTYSAIINIFGSDSMSDSCLWS